MSLSREPRSGKPRDREVERLLLLPGRRRWIAGVLVAVAGPTLITVLATIPTQRSTAVAALLYLLAVVAATAVGRLWPALLSAGLSFVMFDYYFTAPLHQFRVAKGEDLFALAVFLLVAAAVSAALSAALEQRARAESREHQVRALYNVTSRLLSGAGLDAVLVDLAGSLRSLYGLQGGGIVVLDREQRELERAS